MPQGAAHNVGQLYYMFGQAINGEAQTHPDFDTAVELHRFIDTIRKASDEGKAAEVPA